MLNEQSIYYLKNVNNFDTILQPENEKKSFFHVKILIFMKRF